MKCFIFENTLDQFMSDGSIRKKALYAVEQQLHTHKPVGTIEFQKLFEIDPF